MTTSLSTALTRTDIAEVLDERRTKLHVDDTDLQARVALAAELASRADHVLWVTAYDTRVPFGARRVDPRAWRHQMAMDLFYDGEDPEATAVVIDNDAMDPFDVGPRMALWSNAGDAKIRIRLLG